MIAYGVLTIYAALAIWAGLLVRGFMRGRYTWFLLWGIGLLLVLNIRYVIEGAPDAIAFFIGIYDVLDNLGAPDIIGLQEIQDDSGATDDGTVSAQQTLQAVVDALHRSLERGDDLAPDGDPGTGGARVPVP